MPLPKLRGKNVGMNLNRMEKKNVVCGNGIAEIDERYKKSTHILILSVFFFTETVWFVMFFYDKKKLNGIVAMALPK